jgi:isopenicillin N synthase-like dioxygenase
VLIPDMSRLDTIRLDDAELGERLCAVLRDLGFFVLELSEEMSAPLKRLQDLSQRFFLEEGEEEKKKITMKKFRGYSGLGDEVTLKKRDWHETLDFIPQIKGEALDGENQFPSEEYKEAVKNYYKQMNIVGAKIMRAISEELERKIIDDSESPFSLLRVLWYPPIPENDVKTEANNEFEIGEGIGLHTDYGFLSIIHSKTAGLQVQSTDATFLNVKCETENQFIVNIGDAFAGMIPGFRATPHRVVHQENRLSVAFFYEPHYYQKIPDGKGGHFQYGDYLYSKYRQSYPSN